MGTNVAQNIILLAGLAVQIVAVIFLVRYVRATKGIEKASNEQSEGLSKPVVTVRLEPVHTDEAILAGLSCQMAGDQMELANIGTGPALKLSWRIKERGHSGPNREAVHEGFVPYLPSGHKIATPIMRGYLTGDDSFSVECTYRSISDAEYVSQTEFEGMMATGFSVERRAKVG